MLLGEYQHTLDEKNRIFLPAKLKDGLGESFIVTRGLEACLFLFPLPEWGLFIQKIQSLSITREKARTFSRLFFSGAQEVQPDKQGRLVIPPLLLEYSGIRKDAVLLGVNNRAELWAKETWKSYFDDKMKDFTQTAEDLFDL